MPFPSLKVHAQRIRYCAINAIIARVFKSLPLCQASTNRMENITTKSSHNLEEERQDNFSN